MQLIKQVQYFVLSIFLVFAISSCEKCSALRRFFSSKQKTVNGTIFEISDVRIGAGKNDISQGKIVFNEKEEIIITFDVRNFTTLSENWLNNSGVTYYWLREDLVVRDKNGGIVLLHPAMIDGRQPLYAKPLKFKNSFSLANINGVKPGRYTISLLVTDLIGFKTTTTTIPVKIQ